MVLVNLGHVCSHLQNASLARLGLTSVPYTKLHLSFSLLLLKQGFLSQVKLAGPSPPASCFPNALPDNRLVTSAPHRDQSPWSGEAALADLLAGKTVEELRTAGFDDDAIAFAERARTLSAEQLANDGWDKVASDFIIQHRDKSQEQLTSAGLDDEACKIALEGTKRLRRIEEMLRSQPLSDSYDRESLTHEDWRRLFRSALQKEGFDQQTLQYFAGPKQFATASRLEQEGTTISAMGLDITGQPVSPLPAQFRDRLAQEEEGVITQANRASRRLWLGLKYWEGRPVISKARLVSKPSKRIWLTSQELGAVVRGDHVGHVKGMGQVGEIMAISTDRGLLEARECVERKIGGQAMCRVW
ncbi:hypothetical protein K470DRAFT_4945 [Piedraia hortae CBS 480.64]|uniref:Ribosomal protein S8 n=1 Tax=Piedraia hortae CBS 480.64 TaxID=1314780 RepID=A0A6A7CBC9_9PEZI|nr:hypothetical protein K470DRAFT_4945 [Piedraia hortae CBS 480.64]